MDDHLEHRSLGNGSLRGDHELVRRTRLAILGVLLRHRGREELGGAGWWQGVLVRAADRVELGDFVRRGVGIVPSMRVTWVGRWDELELGACPIHRDDSDF